MRPIASDPKQFEPEGDSRARTRLTRDEFARLFQDSSRQLWCIAAAVLGDRSEAHDAVQDAAVIGLQKLDQFDPDTSYAAWMGQIVRNVSRNLARRVARGPTPSSGSPHLDAVPDRSSSERNEMPITRTGAIRHDQRSFDDDVLAALESLSETARACLLLRTVLQTPHGDIATLLGIPMGTAMSHVHRARTEMRNKLGEARSSETRTTES